MKKRIIERIISLLLSIVMILSCLPMSIVAVPSIKTDADFFAKLNLNTVGMESVKSAVSSSNYTNAKSALLTYYKNKFANYHTVTDGTGGDFGTLAMVDTFAYYENVKAHKTIEYNSGAFKQYSLGVVSDTTGVYVLSAVKKTSYSIEIASKEYATASMRPVLKCYNSSGTLLGSVNPSADGYVKYGAKTTNYGSATTLFVRHDSTTTLPYSTNSQRAYLKFTLPSGTAKTELVIYAKINGGSAATHTLDLYQFAARGTAWTEANLTWQWLIDNKVIGHYAYDGVTGGYDWADEEGTPPYDWVDAHCRLFSVNGIFQFAVASGVSAADKEAYLNKGKSLLFDFINDADVTGGWPDGRDKETPFRLNYAPFFYKTLLANNKLTADENVTFLKWIYDEVEYLNGGGNLFPLSSAPLASSAYGNHVFHHISGFYSGLSYFSEFSNASTWRTTYESRWTSLINEIGLLGTDGSYNEGALGAYAMESMTCVRNIVRAMNDTGDTTSAKAKLYTSYMIKFMRFMMDMTFPNGNTPATGQRWGNASKSYITRFLEALSHDFYNDQGVQELKYFIDSNDGTEPDTVAYYPIGQFATDRTGYTTNDSMIYMSARAGGNYDHPDALALLMYNGGKYLLAETDYTQTTSNTTAAHNTIECNGTNQRTTRPPLTYVNNSTLDSVGNKNASSMSAWTDITDGYNHYREVNYLKALNGIVIVTDKAQKKSGTGTIKYVQNWHTSSGSNATVATDNYDTGKTAFSSGSNLVIAQTSGNSITSSVSGNNFKYTQSVSGTAAATYQTVLYPVKAGATATVQPNKITLNVADSVARASQITIDDSAHTSLRSLYVYQSFEETPTSRAFGKFTTDASNAAIAHNWQGERFFASMTNGSVVTDTTSGATVLKTSEPVTDLSAKLNGTTLELESSDANINNITVTANLDDVTVSKVTLNGEEMPSYKDANSNLVIGQQIIHFYGDEAGDTSKWYGNQITLTWDTANSVVNGVATGTDPYFYHNAEHLNYLVKSGDIIEIRLKTTIDSTTAPIVKAFYQTSDGQGFGGNGGINGTRTGTYVDGEFSTIKFTIPSSKVGKTITKVRIDPFDGYTGATFSLDYIYIGSSDKAPSTYKNSLFFDFTNDEEAERRYTSEAYGDKKYDEGGYASYGLSTEGAWYVNGGAISDVTVSGGAIAMTQVPEPDAEAGHWGYISTADCLRYHTNSGDIIQVRLKTLNMELVSGKAMGLSFYANNSTADLYNTTAAAIGRPDSYADDTWYTLQAELSGDMINADYLTSARLQWANIKPIDGKVGKVVIDYIYVGPKANAPGTKSIYNIAYNDGFNLLPALDVNIGTSTVNRGSGDTSTYSVSNKTVTMTNTRSSGETYHYFNKSGQTFNLTAGKEYRFSCTTSGTWGNSSQVQAFLRTGSTHVHMDSNNFTFTPTITGTYHLRFDVNVAGETHTFSNVRIVETSATNLPTGNTASSTHYFGEAKTLTSNAYTRTGYTFKGWSTTRGATTATYTNAQSVKNLTNIPDSTVTLYAVWELNKYTVSYNANGGSGAPSAQTKTHGTALTLSTTKPTREGYTFEGWNTAQNGSGTDYASGGSYTSNASVTLYAQWAPAITYTVKYDANGGTGTTADSTHVYGTAKALTANGFTRTGYTFLGWSKSKTATTATYTNKQSVTNLTSESGGTVILYAVWTTSKYTVTYNANGGSGAPSAQTKTHGIALTLSSVVPTRTGYTFSGWNTKSDGTGTNYTSGANYTANSNLTLYAKWTAITYTVKYNANGGTGTTANSSHVYDTAKALTANGFTRTNYVFIGWSKSNTATAATYTDKQSVSNLTTTSGTVNLYAVWVPSTYKITYNANGGSGAPSAQTKAYGTALTLSSTVPTRTGYTFAGWNTKSDGTGTNYASGASYTNNAVATLYAKWTAITYTVKYNANGGTGSMSNSTHTYGTAKALTANDFTRTNYTFLGWSTSSTATAETYTDCQSVKNLTSTSSGTVNLYAVWALSTKVYTVKYNDGTNLFTLPDDSPKVTAAGNSCTYSILNGKITATNTNTSEAEAYFTVPNMTAYLEAGKTYTFSATTDGTWGGGVTDTVQVHLNTGSTYINLYTLSVMTFTVEVTGTYSFRIDINGYGKTHTFSNIRIVEGETKSDVTGYTNNSLHVVGAAKNLTANGFTKPGYTLSGWSKTRGGTKAYNNSASVTNLMTTSGETTLYAVWVKNSATVKYNDGTNLFTIPDNVTTETQSPYKNCVYRVLDNQIIITNKNTSPASNGVYAETYHYFDDITVNLTAGTYYTFSCTTNGKTWNHSESISNSVEAYLRLGNTSTHIHIETQTFTFTPEVSGTYHLRFDVNSYNESATFSNFRIVQGQSASTITGYTNISTHTYGTAGTLRANGFTRPGYTFKGWSTGRDSTVEYAGGVSDATFIQTNNGTKTLYAVWTANTYTIKFNGNGNTGGSTADLSMTYDTAKKLTANGFTKTGYAFAGWNTKADGTGTNYTNQQSVKNLTATNGGTVT
ncbi:MAG: InlB B-repeat-containing protein, partial [Clostridia bacterium]|nr:InlB B-repeat-containing protein [Clostridia bacterium]